jgi:hypothetical protein
MDTFIPGFGYTKADAKALHAEVRDPAHSYVCMYVRMYVCMCAYMYIFKQNTCIHTNRWRFPTVGLPLERDDFALCTAIFTLLRNLRVVQRGVPHSAM